MCLLICLRQSDGSLLLAANRDERYDRPSTDPLLWPGRPRILAGRDDQAGGTWLAINEHGVVAAVTNRPLDAAQPSALVAQPPSAVECSGQTSTAHETGELNHPSRGGLPLLACRQTTAQAAAMKLQGHLRGVTHDGFNLLIADRACAYIIQNANRPTLDLVGVGTHVVANRGWDDPGDRRVALALDLLKRADAQVHSGDVRIALDALAATCRFHGQGNQESLCIHSNAGGTVSSTLLAMSSEGTLLSYRFCPAAPCRGQYVEMAGRM